MTMLMSNLAARTWTQPTGLGFTPCVLGHEPPRLGLGISGLDYITASSTLRDKSRQLQ